MQRTALSLENATCFLQSEVSSEVIEVSGGIMLTTTNNIRFTRAVIPISFAK